MAPVRETCAQCLGSAAKLMPADLVRSVVLLLLQLLQHADWEARHGGLLGLKYVMAARQDLWPELLPSVYPYLFQGLQDGVDDVSAVAAAALVPQAHSVVQLLAPEQLERLLVTLWDSLLDLDELTASTSSMLALLSSLVEHPDAVDAMRRLDFAELVPRLWPFLAHSSSQVRRATVATLRTLLAHPAAEWVAPMACDLLRHVFQRALLEHNAHVLEQVEQLWTVLVESMPLQVLLPVACPCVASWLCLLMQPARVAFDPAALVFPQQHRSLLPDSAGGAGESDSASRCRFIYLFIYF